MIGYPRLKLLSWSIVVGLLILFLLLPFRIENEKPWPNKSHCTIVASKSINKGDE